MEPVILARTSQSEAAKLAPLMLAVLLLGAQNGAQALGVGRPLTLSALGQPLNLVFPIQLGGDEALTPDCARAEVIAGETRIPAGLVQVQLEGESDSTVRAVRVQSLVPVDEPLVTVSLSLGCPTRFTRQFTAFVDPPALRTDLPQEARLPDTAVRSYSPQLRAALSTADARPGQLLAPTASPAAPQLAQLPAEAASAPAPKPASARRPPRSNEVSVAAAGEAEAASAPARAASAPKPAAKPPRKPAATTVASAGPAVGAKPAPAPKPRLQLEPAEALETALPASAPLPAASAPAPDAGAERIKRLEENLQRMQAQSRETTDKLALLRNQLEQEHSARYQNPVVYVLAVLLAGLAAFCAYLWRARARDRALHESNWWNEVKTQAPHANKRMSREPEAMGLAGASLPLPLDEAVPAPTPVPTPSTPPEAQSLAARISANLDDTHLLRAVETPEEDHGGHSTVQIPQLGDFVSDSMLMPPPVARRPAYSEPLSVSLVEQTIPLDARAASAAAQKPLSVESLIDLEQQAEFFMLLGQDGAAIELLSGRLTGAVSPWPYLMLLEIYQRQGDRSAFELVGESYAHQFGVPTLDWDWPLGDGPGLPACPEVLHLLEKIWIDNAASMDLLRGLLSRGGQWQGGRVAMAPADLQDLALMRDMLMLYLVARDLAEHPARTAAESVDLVLPLDGGSSNGLDLDLDLDITGDPSVAH
ncbi:hypothetical protein J7U46_01595 [Pelomonas sp. V22]|uniref:type IV pilus assembly protein FimV n=1 Tax=Pelomonas sp. V22 TaxID=2822139 RepID=UPI0024A7A5FB|nr:hypothetical protein [Pelomonas sp. V22]MDI4631735.1 hypothetical protein [Pelomonas sp. V22]